MTYLLINLFTIAGPLGLSFDKRVNFRQYWHKLALAIALPAAFFIAWDALFTHWGVWSFSPKYTLGITWLGLPLEEWMFFLTVPYACTFVYACLEAYFPKNSFLDRHARSISLGLAIGLLAVGLIFYDRAYTASASLLTAAWLFFRFWQNNSYMGRFYRAYLVCLLPFLLVNGILTYLPVVMYNDAENLGVRIISIPIEDTVYGMLLQLMNIHLFLRKQVAGNR